MTTDAELRAKAILPHPMFMLGPVINGKIEVQQLKTIADVQMVMNSNTPTGTTPLEAAHNTFKAAVGLAQVMAQDMGVSAEAILDMDDGTLFKLLRPLQNLIDELEEAERAKEDQFCGERPAGDAFPMGMGHSIDQHIRHIAGG